MKTSVSFLCVLFSILIITSQLRAQTNVVNANQGYQMRLEFDNRGAFGKVSYGLTNPPQDSIGLDYPIGARVEHIYGGGLWVGGLLDTSNGGTSPPVRLVTTGFKGWSSPFYEFYPGPSVADSIWTGSRIDTVSPTGWDSYWGAALPYRPVADDERHCRYRDDNASVSQHIPMHLEVIQSSYTWNDTYSAGIHIIRYKVINTGTKPIDSVYVGIFLDGDVGPISIINYWNNNSSGFRLVYRLGFINNPVNTGSTPVGVSYITLSPVIGSQRLTFQWYSGPASPGSDAARYALMSSGQILPDEYPSLSDTRFLLATGPSRIRPITDPAPDTLILAMAILSGQDILQLQTRAFRALDLYQNMVLNVEDADNSTPGGFRLDQNYPNPFNPSTSISFSLPQSGFVSLKVFSMLGQEVTTLVSKDLTAGAHQTTWDATGFPSGVYFYRLQAGSFTKTRKLVLLR